MASKRNPAHPGEKRAVELAREGQTTEQIAEALGVTRNAIWAWTYLVRKATERSESQTAIAKQVQARWRKRAGEAGKQ